MCDCPLCTRHRRAQEIKNSSDIAKMTELIDELENMLFNIEFELEVDTCILNGSWPSTRQYAERIIQICDEREKAVSTNSADELGKTPTPVRNSSVVN